MEFSSVRPTALKWGVIMGFISIGTFFIGKDMDPANTSAAFGMLALGLLIGAVILFLAFREYKGLNNGFMSLGKAMGLGMLVYAISYALSLGWSLIYASFIEPDYYNNMFEKAMEAAEANPDVPEQALQMTESINAFTWSPMGQILFTIIGAAFMGAIMSLILGAIFKKDPQ